MLWFQGWKNKRVVNLPSLEVGRIVLVLGNDSPAQRSKVNIIIYLLSGSHIKCIVQLHITYRPYMRWTNVDRFRKLWRWWRWNLGMDGFIISIARWGILLLIRFFYFLYPGSLYCFSLIVSCNCYALFFIFQNHFIFRPVDRLFFSDYICAHELSLNHYQMSAQQLNMPSCSGWWDCYFYFWNPTLSVLVFPCFRCIWFSFKKLNNRLQFGILCVQSLIHSEASVLLHSLFITGVSICIFWKDFWVSSCRTNTESLLGFFKFIASISFSKWKRKEREFNHSPVRWSEFS